MALTRQTMTDEQRKSVSLEYHKAFDKAGVTSGGGRVLDLFAEDAQVYFPKFGLANGREAIGRLFADVGGQREEWGRESKQLGILAALSTPQHCGRCFWAPCEVYRRRRISYAQSGESP